MKKRFFVSLAILFAALVVSAECAAQTAARTKLSPRGNVLPYSSREEALTADASRSGQIIPLTGWQAETVADGIRYTVKFKRNYRYDDSQLVLRVEGALGAVRVDVNGNEAGYASSGIGRNEFDLTKLLQPNNNTIGVTVLAAHPADVLEQGRTNDGSFRRAMLLTSPRVAISDLVANTSFNADNGLLNLGVVMQSFLLNSKTYEVFFELLDPDGKKVASGNKDFATRMLSRDTVTFFARVPKVRTWSASSPDLYTVVVYTRHENRIKQYATRRIGFRTAELQDGKLTVNGSPVALKVAEASFATDTEARLKELKASGVNMVLVPAPQPDEFYDLCDRVGMMVCDQADIDCSKASAADSPSNNPALKDEYLQRAEEMYYSSKEHPSVMMFSLARKAQNGICMYECYLAMKGLKDARPIIYPEADGEWDSDEVGYIMMK